MENNTITPNPEPKPQPVAPMPVFGGAAPTPTVAPATPPAAAPLSSPTSTLPGTVPAPAASAAGAAASVTAAAPAPIAPASPNLSSATAVAANAAPPQSTSAPAAPSTTPLPTSSPITAPATPSTSAPTTPAAPTPVPAAGAAAPGSTPSAQPPINKGRLVALIAIIAGLLVAGIIAAVIIALLAANQPDPAANAEAALTNLESPTGAPTGIAGNIELVNNDDVIASASVILEDNNLFFTYDGVSDVLESYLGLASVADQESISSLVTINSILQFAESTWWQIPVEDLTLAAEYRAHPFLVLASANEDEYHLRINGNQFADFLTALGAEFTAEEATNCIDGAVGTNCSSDSDFSFMGMTTAPTLDQIKTAVSNVDLLATIDSEHRFTSFYAVIGEDEFVANIKLDLLYADASRSPEEYRPITELMSQFLETIGY